MATSDVAFLRKLAEIKRSKHIFGVFTALIIQSIPGLPLWLWANTNYIKQNLLLIILEKQYLCKSEKTIVEGRATSRSVWNNFGGLTTSNRFDLTLNSFVTYSFLWMIRSGSSLQLRTGLMKYSIHSIHSIHSSIHKIKLKWLILSRVSSLRLSLRRRKRCLPGSWQISGTPRWEVEIICTKAKQREGEGEGRNNFWKAQQLVSPLELKWPKHLNMWWCTQ